MGEKAAPQQVPTDPFRHPLARYLAYADEIGNAVTTYGPCGLTKYMRYFPTITHTYIIMDTLSKGKKAYNLKNNPPKEEKKDEKEDNKDDKKKKGKDDKKSKDKKKGDDKGGEQDQEDKPPEPTPPPILAALDRYGWHMLASVVIPRYTLRQVHCGLEVFADFLRLCRPVRTYFTTALALASIPLIIRPIDAISDHIMDMSYRTVFGTPKSEENKDEKKDEEK
ncbi:mitochondrial fission process protein 1-like [Chrysoperla carnea]|uniref:mitochondrial fission process protein 1-like n=1 Tax=Chrysoperla carnea TaxID=189513 RepID=UPI001D08995A|nr:mitochondrial fission process protein 1-like [Chrysoperla carnea]